MIVVMNMMRYKDTEDSKLLEVFYDLLKSKFNFAANDQNWKIIKPQTEYYTYICLEKYMKEMHDIRVSITRKIGDTHITLNFDSDDDYIKFSMIFI